MIHDFISQGAVDDSNKANNNSNALRGPVPGCPHLDADDVHEHGEVGEMFALAHGVGDVSVHHLTAERRPTTVHRPENTTLGYMSICIISYSGKIGDFLQQLKISYERFSPPPPPQKKKHEKNKGKKKKRKRILYW